MKKTIHLTKRPCIGLIVLLILLLSLNTGTSKANVIISAPTLTLTGCAGFPTPAFTLGNIVISETTNNDISAFGTIILSAPANFEFTSSGTISFTAGRDIASATVSYTASQLIITIVKSGNGKNYLDAITLSGITVRGINMASGPASVTRTGGTALIAGDVTGTVHATLTSSAGTSPIAPTAPDIARCGPGSVTLSASGGSYSNYFWFDENTGGNLLSMSASYTTPNLTSTRSYHVSCAELTGERSFGTGTLPAVTCMLGVSNSAQLFNITDNLSQPVVITRLAVSNYYTTGTCNAQVFFRTSSYVGNETSSEGWSQVYNGTVTRGATTLIDVEDFVIPAGTTYGIYVYFTGDPSAFISGSGTYSNSEITIKTGSIECNIAAPFSMGSGSLYAGYSMTGTVYYQSIGCISNRTICQAIVNNLNSPSVNISSGSGAIICSGENVTFAAIPVNGGSSPSYQWKKNGLNTGTNSSTYSNSALANNDIVTCVLTPSVEICPSPASTTSNAIKISVLTATTINTNPANISLCQKGSTVFTCESTPAGPYQWQVSKDGGASWENITEAGTVPSYSGYTSSVLSLTGTDDQNNGYKYRCMAGCTPSGVATLSVSPVSDPIANHNGNCTPGAITLSASGAGGGEDYLWYTDSLGGAPVQTGGSSYTTPVINTTTTYYVTKYTTIGPFCESYPRSPVIATIYSAPNYIVQPTDVVADVGSGTYFSVVANGLSLSYQWQVNDGSGWKNISAAGSAPTYSGFLTDNLNLAEVALGNNGYQYRCITTGICSFTAISDPATLGVNITPETYLHPTTGIQSTYLGSCMETTCLGYYYDDGGAAGPYAPNINNIYRTFCPNAAEKAVRATVSGLDIAHSGANCNDILYIQNGPNQAANIIWAGCGSGGAIYTAAGNYNAGVITSTHMSGCLTFRFASGTSNPAGSWDGWGITLSCVDFPAGPSGAANTDCINSKPICSDVTASSFTYGPGLTSDACSGCATSENFVEWYHIKMATGGTIELEVVPNGVSDLDFAIYKASTCGSLGEPIRCSYAARTSPGKTGMRLGQTDVSEDVYGDQWVKEINAQTGDNYYLMINEWNKPNPNQYTLDWTLSNGASFDCEIVLPINLLYFNGSCQKQHAQLNWVTVTETNNERFVILKSKENNDFSPIGYLRGAGNSNQIHEYSFTDPEKINGTFYYKLQQIDFDGKFSYSDVISVDCNDQSYPPLIVGNYQEQGYINLMFEAIQGMDYVIKLSDLEGRILITESYRTNGDQGNVDINTSQLAPGIYNIRVLSATDLLEAKVMVY